MPSIMEQLAGQLLGGQMSGQLGQILGTDEGTAKNAISSALPMIVGALASNASKPGGADALMGALDRDHDGSILDDLGGFLGRGDATDGDGILKHALGNRRDPLEKGIAKAAGLDAQKTAMLMSMLAPVVMGALGKAKKEQHLDAGGLDGLLRGESQVMREKAPEMDLMASLLDQDGDGSVVDDVIGKIGGSLLGGFLKGK